jgi:hypothetical protein
MALDGNRLGSAIWAAILASKPTPGTTVVNNAYLENMWQAVGREIINEIVTNGEIRLEAGDVSIPADGYLDGEAMPVTGTALNAATGPLPTRIT